MSSLKMILEGLSKSVLVTHGSAIGADKRGKKGELAARIAARILATPSCLLKACSDADRLLLSELVHEGTFGVDPKRFISKYGVAVPVLDRWGYYDRKGSSVLILVTHVNDSRFELATDLCNLLKPLLPAPAGAAVETTAELPAQHTVTRWRTTYQREVRVYEGAAQAFEEARRVLALVQQGKVRVSESSKLPTAATVKSITDQLLVPDLDLEPVGEEPEAGWFVADDCQETGPVRAHAWPVLVQQCGWAKPQGTKLVLMRKGNAVLTSPTPELWKEGFCRLLNDRTFDELHRVPNIRGQTGRGKRTRVPTDERRLAIADALSEWPVGEWIAFPEAARFAVAAGHDFSVNRSPWNLYFQEHGYGHFCDGAERELARQYLRVFLMESLATLGLVDIAYVPPHGAWPEFGDSWGIDELMFCGRYDGLLFVRLNTLGAYCLGLTDEFEPPAHTGVRLRVLANRDVLGIDQPELPPAVTGLLEMYAKRRSDAVWRLDEKLIIAHLERGGSTDDLREFLARNGVDALPETVVSFLDDIDRRAKAIVGTEEALVVRFRDPETVALIASDPAARKLCLAVEGNVAVVSKKSEKAFRALLRRKGYPVTI